MRLLQVPNLGNGGRLGNQLFTIASCIGLSLKYGYTPRFQADWKYRQYFNVPDEWFGEMERTISITEKHFEYDPEIVDYVMTATYSITLHGYFQSPRYWRGFERHIREYLTTKGVTPIEGTAVHIRRGDYVGNPNYAELPMSYYLNAIDNTPSPHRFFSDDNAFLHFHFQGAGSNNEINDFIHMCGHSHHIVSNSTFSWWAAYLSGGTVIRPDVYFSGKLEQRCNTRDFWPEHWFTCLTSVKHDLSDVTFVIPVTFDHPDRLENVKMVVNFLNLHFKTNIIIGEVNTRKFEGLANYVHFDMPTFHRTKVINELTRMAKTPYVFNWDADVLVAPYQIYKAVKMLRDGVDVVYPYDGAFCMVDRRFKPENLNTLSSLIGRNFPMAGATANDRNSYGGALGYNVEAFFKAGGENENFIGYGAEDQERWRRLNLMCNVERVAGAMYHINHFRGEQSSFRHKYGRHNIEQWRKLQTMNDDQIIDHIKTFTWLR